MPALVGTGEDVAADDSNSCARYHVVRIMLPGLDAAVGHKRCRRIGRNAVRPAVTLAHELRSAEGNRTVSRGKGFAVAAVGASLINRIFEAVGDAERDCG